LTGEQLVLEVINAMWCWIVAIISQHRFAINKPVLNIKTALVSGAAIRFEGQVSVFTPGKNNSPCYNCVI